MANQFQTSEREMYGSVSAFYLALWAHVDAFSDQSRWLRASDTPSTQERAAELSKQFETLQEMKIDHLLMSSISNEFKTTLRLADEFLERGATDVALRRQVEDWESDSAELGTGVCPSGIGLLSAGEISVCHFATTEGGWKTLFAGQRHSS